MLKLNMEVWYEPTMDFPPMVCAVQILERDNPLLHVTVWRSLVTGNPVLFQGLAIKWLCDSIVGIRNSKHLL